MKSEGSSYRKGQEVIVDEPFAEGEKGEEVPTPNWTALKRRK